MESRFIGVYFLFIWYYCYCTRVQFSSVFVIANIGACCGLDCSFAVPNNSEGIIIES